MEDEDEPVSKCTPVIRTQRFSIYKHEIVRDEKLGGMLRSVFHAWHHSEDWPRPACVVTVNECFKNFVEWVHVEDQFRREGVATEVVRAIELEIGTLTMEGATDEGMAFCETYFAKYPEPVQ